MGWKQLGSALNLGLGGGIVYSLADYNGDIYAGGSFWRTGGSDYVNHIAKWNGTNWSTVGEGTDFASAALAVYDGNLMPEAFTLLTVMEQVMVSENLCLQIIFQNGMEFIGLVLAMVFLVLFLNYCLPILLSMLAEDSLMRHISCK